jgi:hypothetical protein
VAADVARNQEDPDFDVQDHDEPDLPVFPARFAQTGSGPDDQLSVSIPGLDGGRTLYGPVLWTPRPGPVYPTTGDRCWVFEATDFDGVQEWIVLHWQPA